MKGNRDMTDESHKQDGFEYQTPGDAEATFYRWAVSDGAKDLMLIDRFTGMPVHEFFELIEDNFDRGRAPILLALLATSIRAKHPEWSVERVTRTVQNLSLSDVAFIDGDAEEVEPAGPPAESGQPETRNGSVSLSAESKSSATPPENSPSETSAATPA